MILYLEHNVIAYNVCSPSILEVNYRPNGVKDSSTAVIGNTEWPGTFTNIDTSGDPILITTENLKAEITRTPFTFRLMNINGKQIVSQGYLSVFPENSLSFTIRRGNVYGITNNQRGTLTKNNGGEIEAGAQGGAGAPFFWSTEGWGLLCDADGGNFSVGENSCVFIKSSGSTKQDLDVYFLLGNPAEIFSALTDITGKPPLFPKFSLGFLNTEWDMDEKELLNDVRMYREKDIPIAAYILDFDWMAYGEDNYGEFRWGPKFPGASTGALQNKLDSLNLKMFGIRKPRIHLNTVQGDYCDANGFFVDYQTDYFTRKRVGRLNFLDSRVREWYWKSFAEQEGTYDKGIIGYWNDEADEYGGNFMFMQMQRANYEGQRQYNNKRVWSINRNFYLGAQRYAYAHWSGDISTGFQSMAEQRLFMLSSINLGSSWWSMDTGGFYGTPGPENYIRWIQFAAFVPVMRVHGTFGEEREPWNYGPTAEVVARNYIRLRHSLIPYIYTYAWRNHLTGVSIVRPLCFVYPDNPELADMVSQWFFGEELLVRPVTEPTARNVSVYLPPGDWYDFHNGNLYAGPGYIEYPVTIEDIPILVKAGAIIPTQPVGKVVDDPDVSQNLMHLVCYPGDFGSFTLYEDDGVTFAYEQNVFCTTDLEAYHTQENFIFDIGSRIGAFQPPQRDYMIEVKWLEAEPSQVSLDGEILEKTSVDSIQDSSITAWAFEVHSRSAFIRLPDKGAAHGIAVQLSADLEPVQIDSATCTTDTSVVIYFSEKVLTSEDENSAENIDNYHIDNDITILRAVVAFDLRKATLITTPHEYGQTYTLTVSNIADLSAAKNVMPSTSIEYTCDMALSYSIIIQEGVKGYTGTSDAHIAEFFPDNNMGGNPQFEACRYAGDNDNDDKSMLIKFDLSTVQLPLEMPIKVELVLTLLDTRFGTAGKYLACHWLLKDWNEGEHESGIDGALAQTGWVTWRSARQGQVLWQTPGGDFDVPEDEIFVGNDIGNEHAWDVSNSFNYWIEHPDSNFGVILREKISSRAHGTKVFAASEYGIPQYRPKLKLAYTLTSVDIERDTILPNTNALLQNYPNPFNPNTSICFSIAGHKAVPTLLQVYNFLGQRVRTLVKDKQAPGDYQIEWDGKNETGIPVTSGVYLIRLESGDFIKTRKMLLIK